MLRIIVRVYERKKKGGPAVEPCYSKHGLATARSNNKISCIWIYYIGPYIIDCYRGQCPTYRV